MKTEFLLSPEAPGATGGETEPPSVKRTPIIPRQEIDLAKLALNVSNGWAAFPQLELVWIKQPQFETLSSNFNALVNERRKQGSTKPEQVNKLQLLDTQADDALAEVKSYIASKYKTDNAPSYYPQFGIVHTSRKWIFPYDRQERSESFGDMIEAIHDNGFDDLDFGKAFWTGLKEAYDQLLAAELQLDEGVSNKVGAKKVIKKQVRLTLGSLVLLVKANFPDTYKSVLRQMGFQKEDY